MDLFNKNTVAKLQDTLSVQKDEIDYMRKSFDELERMIQASKGGELSQNALTRDFNKVGDPYFNNIFVRRSIDIKAQMISSIPGALYDRRGNPVNEDTYPGKLFKYVNDVDTYSDFIFELTRSMERFGKCFIYFSKDTMGGYPIDMEIFPADRIKPNIKDGVLVSWTYTKQMPTKESTSDYMEEFRQKQSVIDLDPKQVAFIRYKHPTNVYDGLAPGSSAIKEILQDFYAQAYNIKNFQNGAMGKGTWVDPSGTPLTAKQREEAQFAVDQEFNKGVSGAGSSTVLSRKLDWIRTSETNRDLEFINLLNKMRDDILVAQEIPKVLFLSAEATFTNLKEAKKMLWTQTLIPKMHKYEESINAFLFPTGEYQFKFDISAIPELQDEISSKLDIALKFQALGVSLAGINERLGLDLPDSELAEPTPEPAPQPSPEPAPAAAKAEPIDFKKAVEEAKKQMLYDQEKSLAIDPYLRRREAQETIQRLRANEKELGAAIHKFYGSKYKDVETWMSHNPMPEDKNYNAKDYTKAMSDWIEKFSKWLKETSTKWGASLATAISPIMEKIFQKGAARTYHGIGANFELKPARAIKFLQMRGLKLQNAPTEFVDEIINALSGKEFTIAELAKTLSTKWKDVSTTRAKLISITETTAAYNGGRVEGMKELGIKTKSWVNAHDDLVRPSHQDVKDVPVDEPFVLGSGEEVMYPGDGSASESCNCRCSVVSVLE